MNTLLPLFIAALSLVTAEAALTAKPGAAKAGEAKPGAAKSGAAKPGADKPGAAKPAPAADAATTETITLSLTSKDSKATLKIAKIVVEETKGGKTEEYVIDMTERKVFLGNKHESLNDLEVFDNTADDKFEVEAMECGAVIDKSCGFIELPATYQPGMDCTWTLPQELKGEMEYKFDAFEVRI